MSVISDYDEQKEYSLNYVRVLDTRLEAMRENQVCFPVLEGTKTTNYTALNSSTHSTAGTNFNLNNISEFTARDSRMILQMGVLLSLTIQNVDPINSLTVINSDNFGLKQYPLNRCINSLQHKINQASYTLNTNEIIDALARINGETEELNFYDNTQPDNIDSYNKASGSGINPLQSYASAPQGGGVLAPRSLNWTLIGSNTIAPSSTGTVQIQVNFYEPLISVFNNVSKKDRQALYGINGEFLYISWVSDLFNNMFCFVPPTNLNLLSSVVAFNTTCLLNTIYLTPKNNTLLSVPKKSVYQYSEYNINPTTIGQLNIPAGASVPNVSSNALSFTNLPQKILIYARPSNNTRSASISDRYLTLDSLSITFDNGNPNLAGASKNQLYDISVRNGLVMPRPSFCGSVLNNSNITLVQDQLFGCGSVLVVDPVLDLGVRENETVGSSGKFQLQINNANFTNNSTEIMAQATLYVVAITAGLLTRDGTQYTNSLLTTPPDIIETSKSLMPVSVGEYNRSKYSNGMLMGGGVSDFFKKAYNMGSKAYGWAKNHQDEIKSLYDTGKKLVSGGEMPQRNNKVSRLFGKNKMMF